MSDELLVEKLEALELQYAELNQQLGDPEVVADTRRYRKTAKAHSDLGANRRQVRRIQGPRSGNPGHALDAS